MGDRPSIEAEGLWKRYSVDHLTSMRRAMRDIASEFRFHSVQTGPPSLKPGEFWAISDVSLSVLPGEALGIVGPNGAGKSTLLRMLHGLTKPDSGRVAVSGRSAALMSLGSSFTGALTGRENVLNESVLLGLGRSERQRLLDRVVDFAELSDVIDAPVETYSSGMQMRLAYAVAAQLEPEVLLIDEVIAVGDLAFQRKCVQHIRGYLQRGGAVVLVTHDLWMLNAICTVAACLDEGQFDYRGSPQEVLLRYVNEMQVRSVPEFDERFDEETDSADQEAATAPIQGASNPVSVLSARIVREADDGPPRWREDVIIQMEVDCSEELSEVCWSFALFTATDQVCVAISPDSVARPMGLLAGRSTLECRIASWPTAVGKFLLRSVLVDAGSGRLLGSFGVDGTAVVQIDATDSTTEAVSQIIGCLTLREISYEPWGDAE